MDILYNLNGRLHQMAATNPSRVFTAFGYEHDESLRNLLVGQSKHEDSPFEMHDWSVKEPFTGDWKAKVRTRIRGVDQVVVLCGEHTHNATGVAAELTIAQEENKPYFLLWGYSNKTCTKPTSAAKDAKIYKWTWDNLKALIGGSR
jgi:Thoeris protein ThsB, TIR-like domain